MLRFRSWNRGCKIPTLAPKFFGGLGFRAYLDPKSIKRASSLIALFRVSLSHFFLLPSHARVMTM